ncbi:MAG: hypothetical protein KJO17_02125, partial [Acidimicrobiia bacterium]|nr:hypothetical protein [Acidimicrobiia bacterium]
LDGSAAEPHEADRFQVGVEWVGVERLGEIRLEPAPLVHRLEAFLTDRSVLGPMFLGDVL